ncbi:hypothetical protein E5288_WYG018614 [Bos mutus]|uniref:Uncharacterized protein n=1 Tax=Bos mutus TaxID=72004 RepID=A0A6B0QYV2_9CETA|nr:hypothetical protein [Bos mutus]
MSTAPAPRPPLLTARRRSPSPSQASRPTAIQESRMAPDTARLVLTGARRYRSASDRKRKRKAAVQHGK